MPADVLNGDPVTVPLDKRRSDESRRRASAPLVHGERYQLGDELGRGGMGEVCSAYDTQIGREVAIKRLHADQPSHHQLARFLREARIQGRLQHPAIPPVHEIGVDEEGRPYFAMTRLAGVMLVDVLRNPQAHPSFTRQRLLRAFVEVCHAIELAHANGVLHRDIKPSNVLLGDRGEVYLIDWGIAREVDRPTTELAGTPGYMAPEQERGDDDLDGRVDVYALGCVLFEILTGQPRGLRQPPSLMPARDDIPPELDTVCRLATAPDRTRRLLSVRELSEAVQRFLDGDRDLERRRELAAAHLASAQAALAMTADEASRRAIAMREAGRAIALDPTLAGAAQLVGRLMLQPPYETPRAVVEELAVLDRATDRHQLRRVAMLNSAQLVIVPILALLGIRDVPYLVAFGVVALLNVGLQLGAAASERFMKRTPIAAALCALAAAVLLARMFTPFLCAPAAIAVSLMSFGMSSMARRRAVMLMCGLMGLVAVLGVWGAEALGFVSRTTWVEGGVLVLRSPLDGAAQFPIIPMMCMFVVLLLWSAASIANAVSSAHFRTREQLQIQAWQLRQLL